MSTTRVWCLLIDHEKKPMGQTVLVVPGKTIAHLKENINVGECHPHEITVWRCTDKTVIFDDADPQRLEDQVREVFHKDKVQKLGAKQTMEDLQVLEIETLLVQLPITQRRNKRKHDEVGQVEDSPEFKLLKKEVGGAAPSFLAHAGEFRRIAGSDHAIICNRPFAYDTIPIELLDEVFGSFRTRCGASPSKNALAFLEELAPVGCKWYDTELERRDEVQRVFKKYTGILFHADSEEIPGGRYTTDGNLDLIVMPAAIRECRNENGYALNQAIIYYTKFLLQALAHPHSYGNYNTRFPCILMVDRGSTLGFYGAVWDGRVRVDPLMPTFDLATHYIDECGRHAIASSLDAFMEAVATIQVHYAEIDAAAKANVHLSNEYKHSLAEARKYPCMTSYEIAGQETIITYKTQLDPAKLVFTAVDNQPIPKQYIVKFTRRYSEKAHHYLASLESAPKLWQCKEIPGGWIAVIMDTSRYEPLRNLCLTKEDQDKVRFKVTKMLKMLQNGGFVHGDIRDTNLLVDYQSLTSNGLTDPKIHFIDFDWAGCIGQARYPLGVNTITVKRPDGVEDGVVITQEHDLKMVSYLFE